MYNRYLNGLLSGLLIFIELFLYITAEENKGYPMWEVIHLVFSLNGWGILKILDLFFLENTSLLWRSAVLGVWICKQKKEKNITQPLQGFNWSTAWNRRINLISLLWILLLLNPCFFFFIVIPSTVSSHCNQWIWDGIPLRECGMSLGQSCGT